MNGYDLELAGSPLVRSTWYGRQHLWRFKVPSALLATIAPVKGAHCESIAKLKAPGIAGIGSVVRDSQVAKDGDGNAILTVWIGEPVAL